MATDALKNLQTALIDARNGYDEAIKDAESPDLSKFFQEMSDLHRRHLEGIRRALLAEGADPQNDGSFMSAVHTGVIAVRSSITGLAGAMPAFAGGEERLLKSYDEALNGETRGEVKQMLSKQMSDLQMKIGEMKTMSPAS